MEPRFVTREFKLVGIEQVIDLREQFGSTIDSMWARLMQGMAGIANRSEDSRFVGYWAMACEEEGSSTCSFMAAVQVENPGQIPEGFTVETLPESKYAVFREQRRGEMGGPEGYAYTTWLPQSGYQFNVAVGGDLEVYARECGENAECDIYVPIR